MTEKEAIKILRNIQNAKKVEYEDAACAAAWFSIFKYVYPEPEDYVIEEAIKALEEIQQYREIGTIEELTIGKRYISLAKKHGTIGEMIDECAEYESIGTVEECREALLEVIDISFIIPILKMNLRPEHEAVLKIREIIMNMPTAFDKEKVIEELNSERNLMYREDGTLMGARTQISIDRSVEIVEKGGIE